MEKYIIVLTNGHRVYTNTEIKLVNTRMETKYNDNQTHSVIGEYVFPTGSVTDKKMRILEREIVIIIENF
jgi:hypothetical protein